MVCGLAYIEPALFKVCGWLYHTLIVFKMWECEQNFKKWNWHSLLLDQNAVSLADFTAMQLSPKLDAALCMALSPVQFSRSVVSDSLRPHESQHARPPCPPPTPRVHSDSHALPSLLSIFFFFYLYALLIFWNHY